MKKILICGANGFIGRNICEHFMTRKDIELYGTYFRSQPWANQGIKMIKADLRDKTQVDQAVKGMDIIIQAAGTTSGSNDIVNSPGIHITDNVIMNSLIFRSAHEQNVKHIVFFSCTIMYPSSDHPLKESDFDANAAMCPSYFGAGWTKVYLEKQAEFFSRQKRTMYTIIRHSNIYGPHDKYDLSKSHAFGATMTKVINNTDGIISVWGTGDTERDLLHVDDLVNFVSIAIAKQNTPYELVNIGSGRSVSIKDLAQKIIDISGKNIRIKLDPSKPDINTRLCVDCSKANELFGWEPTIDITDGIKRTMEWYLKNIRLTQHT